MNFIFLSDWHLRSSRPLARIDDYHVAQIRKLIQLVFFANEHSAYIVAGGDIWDSPRPGWKLYTEVQRVLSKAQWGIYVVAGQHDQIFHSQDLSNTPLQSLHDAGILTVVKEPEQLSSKVYLHGCSWGEEPSKPIEGFYNVLLAHLSVYEKKVPFYMEGNVFTARTLGEKYPGFNLYLCGDIHIPFVRDDVVVSGSMMRQSIDQKDFRPRCYLIEGSKLNPFNKISPLYFDIEEDVFADYLVNKKDEEFASELNELVDALKASAVQKVDYEKLCGDLAKHFITHNLIKDIFDHVR